MRGKFLAQVSDGRWSQESARLAWNRARTFVRWCYERELLETLPRNLASATIRSAPAAPTPVDPAALRRLVDAAAPPAAAALLLAANCGFGSADIADLRIDQFDPRLGIVTRKRVKHDAREKAPVVQWVLWDCAVVAVRAWADARPEPADPTYSDRLFLTRDGLPAVRWKERPGREPVRLDAIRLALSRVGTKLAASGTPTPSGLRQFRGGGGLLDADPDPQYHGLSELWKGNRPTGVSARHYDRPPLVRLAKSCARLGEQYGYPTDPDRLAAAEERALRLDRQGIEA
ncbi:hypothetical protein [Alienimonas californiensis]|nr:hypothetical protein [Alienimonas californiensis]